MFRKFLRTVDMQISTSADFNFQITRSAHFLFINNPFPFSFYSCLQLFLIPLICFIDVGLLYSVTPNIHMVGWKAALWWSMPVTSQHWNLAHCLFACFLSVKNIKGRVQINKICCEDQKQIRLVKEMCDLHVTMHPQLVNFIGTNNLIKKVSNVKEEFRSCMLGCL